MTDGEVLGAIAVLAFLGAMLWTFIALWWVLLPLLGGFLALMGLLALMSEVYDRTHPQRPLKDE